MKSLLEKRILICCGTGGVGKTTTAAALALKATYAGKRVCLITIDPARRLATSLGLEDLKKDPQNLDAYLSETLEKPKGSLSALMLDSQDTFYHFIEDVGGKEIRSRFEQSNLFGVIAGNFGGTHDYMAMEKLFELERSGNYDLLVLDTPPARHTLDFLDAPDLIARFFDDRVFSWFLTDARSNSLREKIRAKGTKAALAVLEKLTGEGVLGDFVALAPHIHSVKNAFVERQNQVRALLQSKAAGAIFVSSPTDLSKGEARPFLKDAGEKGIHILAFIINRSLSHLAPEADPKGKMPKEVRENYRRLRFLVEEEQKHLTLLKELAGPEQVILTVPELDNDVHDLPSLFQLSRYLA
jgi:anion-transporting  ArsA/GET3 family ATPase